MRTGHSTADLIRRARRTAGVNPAWSFADAGDKAAVLAALCALANGQGGALVLGFAAAKGLELAPGFDARAAEAAARAALGWAQELAPAPEVKAEAVAFDAGGLAVLRVAALRPALKPCRVASPGAPESAGAAWVRTGQGDRLLTPYEIERLGDESLAPLFELEPVPGAGPGALDAGRCRQLAGRFRALHPALAGADDEALLAQLGLLCRVGGKPCPTLAGLLVLGADPLEGLALPGIALSVCEGKGGAACAKPAAAEKVTGSLPAMLERAAALVAEGERRLGALSGAPGYPPEAVREALANALAHRDYSPAGRGRDVEVRMFADRLEVLSPGGLYGPLPLAGRSELRLPCPRNAYLARALALAGGPWRGRGEGLARMSAQLACAGLPPYVAAADLAGFSLTLQKRRRLAEEAPGRAAASGPEERVLTEIARRGPVSIKELVIITGLARPTVSKFVRQLVLAERVEPTVNRGNPQQRYRLRCSPAGAGEADEAHEKHN
ncbi:MAG: hypothetical protein HUK26_08875 [Duodenibacillus sp.]|nr:hypothetical protein [Duodenibacillus sp.]